MICSALGCTNEATHEGFFLIHPIREALLEKELESYKPARVEAGVKICKHHKYLTAYDILTEERWTQVTFEIYRLGGLIQLDRDNVGVEWQTINDIGETK